MSDSDCPSGSVCDTGSGLCVTGCDSDSQCNSTQWCNNPPGGTGTCTPKLPNGTMLPSMPTSVATCNAMVGTRVCLSGVCDTKDNTCGYANGDGPCSSNAQCRNDTCDPTTMTCMQPSMSASSSSGSMGNCITDSDCPSNDYCKGGNAGTGGNSGAGGGNCTPKLGIGQSCTRPTECQSGDCTANVCSDTTGSGNGVICAASPRGDSSGGAAGLFGLVLAAAGLARRRSSSRK
jgi:MYXO-CTERM domain-containing protein